MHFHPEKGGILFNTIFEVRNKLTFSPLEMFENAKKHLRGEAAGKSLKWGRYCYLVGVVIKGCL